MSQLNFNVGGDPKDDDPILVTDDQPSSPTQTFTGRFNVDGPGRFAVTVPPSVSGGATVRYQQRQKSVRVIVPPGPGQWEAGAPPCQPPNDPPVVMIYGPPVSEAIQIVGDHFELHGTRWTWRMTTGFCDYKVFLDGGDIRSLLKQNQDLGAHGRRVFPHIVNITDFNPATYGQAYWDRLPEYLAVNAEYDQYVDFPVLSDTGYRGWSLGQCQDFWIRFGETVRPSWNRFVNLTNEFDHGGNIVGRPDDYPRLSGMLVSQGSAVQDATPPSPGWNYFEWHAADSPTKFSHEYFIWKGLSTGGTPKPAVISEHGRRITEQNADEDYIRSLAYASLANGCGLTVHPEDGKYSRLLGPRQASCVKTAMAILEHGA